MNKKKVLKILESLKEIQDECTKLTIAPSVTFICMGDSITAYLIGIWTMISNCLAIGASTKKLTKRDGRLKEIGKTVLMNLEKREPKRIPGVDRETVK